MRVPAGWILISTAVALGCTTPVSVRRVPAEEVHRALTANVLSTGSPSPASTQVLHRLDLFAGFRRSPDDVLQALRVAALEAAEPEDLLFALAELHFVRGAQQPRRRARASFLAAAFYAFHYLASVEPSDLALDPRYRLAADLYNRGLTSGLATDDGRYVDLEPRSLALPFGSLNLESDAADLDWGGYRMKDFVPVAELQLRGLRNRYRRPGIGAPVAASLAPAEGDSPPPGAGHISRSVRVPATAVVVFEPGLGVADGDTFSGRIRLLTLDDTASVAIGSRVVALESEPTAALAFGLAESRPWEFEGRGFLWGDFGSEYDRGVRMLAPYDPERIPVVFVHGTASSPWRWAEMINHLQSDTDLHATYQFWIFQYNTGAPIPFSAGLLRQGLRDLVAELDPEGDDENLHRMVVVGHSLGGLLAKLCAVESGDAFWQLVSQAPIDELELRTETREVLERSIFFEPLPFVERVVFIATPHRGSFLAERWHIRLLAGMVSFPSDLVYAMGDLVTKEDDRVVIRSLEDMPSSVDQMTRDSAFLQRLETMPIAAGVEAHSIIAVSHDDEDPARAHDGVVTVESQRLGGARSEFVVHSGHSTQRHPLTIGEIARILRDTRESAPRPPADAR